MLSLLQRWFNKNSRDQIPRSLGVSEVYSWICRRIHVCPRIFGERWPCRTVKPMVYRLLDIKRQLIAKTWILQCYQKRAAFDSKVAKACRYAASYWTYSQTSETCQDSPSMVNSPNPHHSAFQETLGQRRQWRGWDQKIWSKVACALVHLGPHPISPTNERISLMRKVRFLWDFSIFLLWSEVGGPKPLTENDRFDMVRPKKKTAGKLTPKGVTPNFTTSADHSGQDMCACRDEEAVSLYRSNPFVSFQRSLEKTSEIK